MKVLRDDFSPKDFSHPVVAIGSFDGVHLGHQALINRAKEGARKVEGEAVVFTFEPHPAKVLFPERDIKLITPLPKKLKLLRELGVDVTIVYPFSRALADKPAEAFVQEVLYGKIRPHGVVVGFNFTFGKGRTGTAETLRELGTVFGFEVEVVPAREVDGSPVSSSRVRELIVQGKVDEASRLLGRPFFVGGRVISGEGRGRNLGFPTANLEVDPDQLLPMGVFAVWVKGATDERLPGVANIGQRPTFGGKVTTFEVHLIGFSGELYWRELEVEFVRKIRDERPFPTPEALARQIARDVEEASRILEGSG